MVLSVSGLLLMFSYYTELERSQLLCLGVLFSLGIFGYTSFMDRVKWAGIFELSRAILGLTLIFMLPNLIGLNVFHYSALLILTAYFALTFLFTFYFAFIDKDYSLSGLQTHH